MHKPMLAGLLASLLPALCANALASTATLTVTGELTPASCTVQFTNSKVNLGNIDMGRLLENETASLPPARVGYSIACSAAIRVGHRWIDESAGAAYGGDPQAFGLGRQGNASLGAMRLTHVVPVHTDRGAATLIHSTDNGASWAANTQLTPGKASASLYAYAAPSSLLPMATRRVDGEVLIALSIAPLSTLSRSEPATLAGEATMEIVYL